MRDWKYAVAVAVLTLIAAVRVASTHRVFSEVLDEPAHVAAGYEWLHGNYVLDITHPPLARILGALPLMNFPTPTATHMVPYGNELLYHGDRYLKTLARVRFGNLLLLVITLVATAAWARRAFSKGVALLSVAFLGTMPPVLAHAGVMTTDLAALTSMVVALLALDVYLEKRTTIHALLLGLAIGAGLLSKFSFLVFFPPCAVILLLMGRRAAERTPGVMKRALAIVVPPLLLVWAGYHFDVSTPEAHSGKHAVFVFDVAAPESLRPFARWVATNVPLPAPAFWVGLGMVKAHDEQGHLAYLFGEHSEKGWWYYFPVIFFYKTPLPFLLLTAWGALLILRERDRHRIVHVALAIIILAISMTSGINIGVRHILPMYAPLAIVAAYGTAEIWRRSTDAFARTTLAALLVWLFAGVALEHPDYLAWFNEAARPNPASIAVDSNLDWGQDTVRFERVLREMQITQLHADIATNARIEGIAIYPFHAGSKVTGWVAVSETNLALKGRYGEYRWLSTYRPVRRIGKSIRLYHIPE